MHNYDFKKYLPVCIIFLHVRDWLVKPDSYNLLNVKKKELREMLTYIVKSSVEHVQINKELQLYYVCIN